MKGNSKIKKHHVISVVYPLRLADTLRGIFLFYRFINTSC